MQEYIEPGNYENLPKLFELSDTAKLVQIVALATFYAIDNNNRNLLRTTLSNCLHSPAKLPWYD